MTDFILCCAVASELLWVVALKLEIGGLRRQQARFVAGLGRRLQQLTGDVECAVETRGWGKRAKVEEVDLSWVKNPGGRSAR